MKIAIDIETDSLANPSMVWLVVCRNLDNGELYVYRNFSTDDAVRADFLRLLAGVTVVVGHNIVEFDLPVLGRLHCISIDQSKCRVLDTLILSRLFNFAAPHASKARGATVDAFDDSGAGEPAWVLGQTSRSHSVESYGEEFGYPKLKFSDFSKYSVEMETYCIRDVDIVAKIYNKFLGPISDPKWKDSIELEHLFQQYIVNQLQDNGFAFNTLKAQKLLAKVKEELDVLDTQIHNEFKPRSHLIREIVPKYTQHGTLHRGDFRWVEGGDLSDFNGGPFSRIEWREFNPASHKQIIEVLNTSGWVPIDKTKAHIEAERSGLDKEELIHYKTYGWRVNEVNLLTLPKSAPAPARSLARRILLEARRRTLTEWLGLEVNGRIHGHFVGIGAWTGRMAHQKPNMANIPNDLDTNGTKKLLGKEMRSLWIAPKNRLLVGVDAEGIQLRIFAHYIDDQEFTDALVRGKKSDKSDPHSLNQRILGSVCKSRQAAKRFIYALLLGAGLWKLSQILECSEPETKKALDLLLERYTGWAVLKSTTIPKDAKNGYFIGLDGRKIQIPGETVSERKHLAMSGYLQSGEAIVMKKASLIWMKELEDDFEEKEEASVQSQAKVVNLVHDEWQTETPNNMAIALRVAEAQSQSLRMVGESLKLKCPLAGSYYNDDIQDYTIGTNWSVTH